MNLLQAFYSTPARLNAMFKIICRNKKKQKQEFRRLLSIFFFSNVFPFFCLFFSEMNKKSAKNVVMKKGVQLVVTGRLYVV